MKKLFEQFDKQLQANGVRATKGQLINASFVDVPKQRNNREENKQIKKGENPDSFKEIPAKLRQKDTDARWTKKNNETHYGYKNHVNADHGNKIICDYEVTSAEVHDRDVLDDILTENTSRDVYADIAYRSKGQEQRLAESGHRMRIIKKGHQNRPLTTRYKAVKQTKSKARVRVEPIFGSTTNEQNGLYFKMIGVSRIKGRIGLMNLVYNMHRFVRLDRMNPSTI